MIADDTQKRNNDNCGESTLLAPLTTMVVKILKKLGIIISHQQKLLLLLL